MHLHDYYTCTCFCSCFFCHKGQVVDANHICNSNVGSVPGTKTVGGEELSNHLTIWASDSDLHRASEISFAVIDHDTFGSTGHTEVDLTVCGESTMQVTN